MTAERDFMEEIGWASPQSRPASGRFPNLDPLSSRRFQLSGQPPLWTPQESPSPSEPLRLFNPYAQITFRPLDIGGFLDGFFGIAPEPVAPLPVERRPTPVIGFRAWDATRVRRLGYEPEWKLESLGSAGWHWSPGKNTAECLKGHGGPVPSERCGCGLYVTTDLDTLEAHIGKVRHRTVVGAVMGWGRVVQHGAEGWRAQYARTLALLDLKRGRKNAAITAAVADSYGLSVLQRSALELLAKEHGDPFPERQQ